MKHTEGPWTRERDQRFKLDQSAGVKSANGMYVVAALDLNSYDRDEEVEANARLIAAAPDLLEACKAANQMYLQGENLHGEVNPCSSEIYYLLEQVIARAAE